MSKYPVHGPIPPKQQTVLDFIIEEVARGGSFPMPEAIAAWMGWKHPGSATSCLHKLRWRGKIRKTGPRAHDWALATQHAAAAEPAVPGGANP